MKSFRTGERMKSSDDVVAQEGRLSLLASLRLYWWGLWLAAVIPASVVLTAEYIHSGLAPVLFVGLTLLGTLVPYRLGKAPYSYVLVFGLVYFFVGSAIAFTAMYLLGIGDVSNR